MQKLKIDMLETEARLLTTHPDERLFLRISGPVAGTTHLILPAESELAVMENVHGDHKI
jgi:hypothetical protein